MKRKIFFSVAILSLALLSTSCSSERRALSQMRTLTHQIETRGDYYEAEDWEAALEKYKKIDAKMEDKSKLSPAQLKEYGELKGRCVAKFAKSSVQKVVDGVTKYINEGVGIIKGIIDGLKN